MVIVVVLSCAFSTTDGWSVPKSSVLNGIIRSVQKLGDALAVYIAAAEDALAEDDPGPAFAGFMRNQVDADAYAIGRLAGRFTPTPELRADLNKGFDLAAAVLESAQAAGAVRADVVPTDIGVLFRLVGGVAVAGDPRRTTELRHRYLALLFDALFTEPDAELPGPAPHRTEFARPWQSPAAPR